MNSHASFWCGCFGAIIPEVSRFFKIASTRGTIPNLNWALYLGMLVMFCVAAGAVAIAWKPDSEWKALWVGASCPAIIATLVQTAPTR
jgi:hypothetical protein